MGMLGHVGGKARERWIVTWRRCCSEYEMRNLLRSRCESTQSRHHLDLGLDLDLAPFLHLETGNPWWRNVWAIARQEADHET